MVASVIVDISTAEIDRIFEYIAPDELGIKKGDRVLVPFGNKTIEGFCIDLKETAQTSHKLKEIKARLDPYSAITEEQLELVDFMRERYFVRYVDCLRLLIPSKLRGGRVRELKRIFVSLAQDKPYEQLLEEAGSPARRAVIERLKNGGEFLSRLTSEVSASCVNTTPCGKCVFNSPSLPFTTTSSVPMVTVTPAGTLTGCFPIRDIVFSS